jgi:hypothetical protein
LYNGLLPFQGAEIRAHYYPGRCPGLIDKSLSGIDAQVIRMETLLQRYAGKSPFTSSPPSANPSPGLFYYQGIKLEILL